MGPKRLKTLLPVHHAGTGRSNIHQNQKRGPYSSVSSSAISTSLINASFVSSGMTRMTATPQIARPKRSYIRRNIGATSSTNTSGSGDQKIMEKIALVESQLNKRIDDLTSRQEVLEILYGSLEREMEGLADLTKFVLNCVNSLFHGFIQVQQQLNLQHFFASQQNSSSGGNVNVNSHDSEGRPGPGQAPVPVPVPMSTFMMPMSAPVPVPLTTSEAAATKDGSTARCFVDSPLPSPSSSSTSSVLHLSNNQEKENQSQIHAEVSDEESVFSYFQNEIRDRDQSKGGENENVEDIEEENEGQKQHVDVEMDAVHAQTPKPNQIKHKRKQLYHFQGHKDVKAERPLMEVIQEYYELETSAENSDSSSSSSSAVVSATSVEILEAAIGTGGGRRAAGTGDCGDISSGDMEDQEGQGRGQPTTAATGTELSPNSTSILGKRLSSYESQHVCEYCLNGFRHKRNLMKHQIIIPMYCRRKRAMMARSTMPTLCKNMIKSRNFIHQRGNIVNMPVLPINDDDKGENDGENERNNNRSSMSNAAGNNVSMSENDEENIAISSSRLSELGQGVQSDVGDKVRLQFGP